MGIEKVMAWDGKNIKVRAWDGVIENQMEALMQGAQYTGNTKKESLLDLFSFI